MKAFPIIVDQFLKIMTGLVNNFIGFSSIKMSSGNNHAQPETEVLFKKKSLSGCSVKSVCWRKIFSSMMLAKSKFFFPMWCVYVLWPERFVSWKQFQLIGICQRMISISFLLNLFFQMVFLNDPRHHSVFILKFYPNNKIKGIFLGTGFSGEM